MCSSYLCPSTKQSVQHFTFYGIKLPLGALLLAHTCLSRHSPTSLPREVRSRVSPQPHPSGKRGRAGGMPGNHPHSQHGWQHGFSSKTRPPAHPGRFHQLIPFARPQLITPKAVQKPQVTTAPACGFLPYLWLSARAWKDSSESENTPGSTDALFLALWQLADFCYEKPHPQLHGSQRDVRSHPEGKG